jgi:hypothetical protein
MVLRRQSYQLQSCFVKLLKTSESVHALTTALTMDKRFFFSKMWFITSQRFNVIRDSGSVLTSTLLRFLLTTYLA